ncbi:DUF2637 domain-containing protein [Bifidobacterium catenulatum]|uniref:DUF2637 domain-containing protein n=1 Tax=Bifidobacterium catenulatum TaxID=1686 RepID=UPI00248151C7|nr:DUF2637 domain-containing protein [Bifidobacterium catenulatum]MDH7880754.1 DUF2637 domain-containing protein [Bifidobacterium catenulatum subsp. kashiwanohense]
MKYTKDEEEKAERSSVKMWPGITAGIIIGLIAFVLSFDALRLVFVSCGINPWLSWGGPVCVDGTILLCTWATWGFKKGHIRGSAYPWVGLVLFSGFSIAGNALHAMISTGFRLPSWVPPVIMSIPPVALLYATHLIVIIAGDRLDKINTFSPATDATRVPEAAPRETRVPVEPVKAQPVQPAPVPMPTPAVETKSEPEIEPMIPDLFDFQTIVPDMEDDADPKAEEAEAPVADASIPTIMTSDSNVPQPVMESHVTIPTLVEASTVTPDIPTETTPEPEAEPVEDTTPSETPVTAVETEEEKDPADAQTETEAGNEPATDDAVKTKPKKTRRNKASADDEEWLAWLDEFKAQNETPTSAKAVEAGLAASSSTAKRYLARIRKEHPERF